MEITTILWREWLFFKSRMLKITVSQAVTPLLYLVTFGIGLGQVVSIDGKPYLFYLIPGVLAMTTMRGSYTAVSTRISVMRLHEKSFECYFYSPTKISLLAFGHIISGALRGIYAGLFVVIAGLVANSGIVINGWFVIAVTINSLLFSALGFLAAMLIETHYDMNNFTNIVITPMSFLCGTFFSLDTVPVYLKVIIECMPLTHTTRLIRGIALGDGVNFVSMLVAVVFVAVLSALCIWSCSRALRE